MPGKVVSREEWLTARKELLVKEKESIRAHEALTASIRSLPMALAKPYTLTGPSGPTTFAALFEGRKQLIVYHFMLSSDEPVCTGCSFVADNLPHVSHLNSCDTTLVLVSRAPYEKIEKFKTRMGWTLPWYSSADSDFNMDFGVTFPNPGSDVGYNYAEKSPDAKGEMPGLSVFLKEGDDVYHTYSTYADGVDNFLVTHRLLEVTPLGREVADSKDWKLHDEY